MSVIPAFISTITLPVPLANPPHILSHTKTDLYSLQKLSLKVS